MIDALTTRAGLTATTAIVAVGLIAILPETRSNLAPDSGLQSRDLSTVTEGSGAALERRETLGRLGADVLVLAERIAERAKPKRQAKPL